MSASQRTREELARAGAFMPSEDFAEWVASLSDDQRSRITTTDLSAHAQATT